MKKTYEELAKEYLSFADKFNFTFQYVWDSPYRKITLSKNDIVISFEELPQFHEKYLRIYKHKLINEIDITSFEKKSIKTDEKYWELIANSLRYNIENNVDLMLINKLIIIG